MTGVGDGVSKFAVGDIVGVGCMVDSCQHCQPCADGLEQYCDNGFTGTYDSPEQVSRQHVRRLLGPYRGAREVRAEGQSPGIRPRRRLAGSLIGGIAETQEMLDFCAEHGIVSDIEPIRMAQINEAYERMLRSDVKYRSVVDMATVREGAPA